jgi:hypothetical protein
MAVSCWYYAVGAVTTSFWSTTTGNVEHHHCGNVSNINYDNCMSTYSLNPNRVPRSPSNKKKSINGRRETRETRKTRE